MATMVGTQKDLTSLLKQLIELEYDALEAYQAAIDRLDDANFKSSFEGFRTDHQRHVTELDGAMRQLGGEPPQSGDIKRVLAKGKVVIGALVGDRAVLMAMKTNEDDTNTAYERACKRDDIPGHLRTMFERNLADERRHRAWIEQTLGSERTERTSAELR